MSRVQCGRSSERQESHLLAAALLASHMVDEYDLDWAKRECLRRDQPLADVLVELELVSPQAIQSCLDSLKRIATVKFEA